MELSYAPSLLKKTEYDKGNTWGKKSQKLKTKQGMGVKKIEWLDNFSGSHWK